ncbi:MAG: hypothetical protein A2X25_10855 [Chloroflexi bacterium GWB2_49_20]|nr:MAG: hypothetical protein A2X25_10855 [Chloroflexi bacterium GWB2_49_20]OGN78943.1 MAG: hypothetical protein A2X26_00500 [Chloroflexi bacterium GWC2_49_37]OGN86296.1 MAG: hypothetical protein A2X27_05280 [Chloroflexi bacterium GWD2_49_16]HBG74523.1 hypothetical protein [Anaerolineae bacterium]
MQRIRFFLSLWLIIIFAVVVALSRKVAMPIYMYRYETVVFNGQRALDDAIEQLNMGPRTPNSNAHTVFQKWLQVKIIEAGWRVTLQTGMFQGHPINNIIAHNSNEPPRIIIAAHYDSRLFSDNDPDPNLRSNPVPGANDGASGVAALLELARTYLTNPNQFGWYSLMQKTTVIFQGGNGFWDHDILFRSSKQNLRLSFSLI